MGNPRLEPWDWNFDAVFHSMSCLARHLFFSKWVLDPQREERFFFKSSLLPLNGKEL